MELYTDTAKFGILTGDISAIFMTVICVILIIIGISMILRPTKRKTITTGVISNVSCFNSFTNSNNDCSLTITYKIDGIVYTIIRKTTNETKYINGESIKLYYDPTNINNIDISEDTGLVLGWILVVFSIVLLAIVWLWNYVIHHSKIAAAFSGASSGINLLKSVF